jgi:hypothetical protein
MMQAAIAVVGTLYGATWGVVIVRAHADQRRNNRIAFRNVQSKASR